MDESLLEHIKTLQLETKEKVDEVYDALYDPDEGLFARIKASAEEARSQANEIEKDVSEIKNWRTRVNESVEQVDDLVERLKELEGWRHRISGIGKWLMGIWTTTMVGLIVKLVYDLIHDHIKFT